MKTAKFFVGVGIGVAVIATLILLTIIAFNTTVLVVRENSVVNPSLNNDPSAEMVVVTKKFHIASSDSQNLGSIECLLLGEEDVVNIRHNKKVMEEEVDYLWNDIVNRSEYAEMIGYGFYYEKNKTALCIVYFEEKGPRNDYSPSQLARLI